MLFYAAHANEQPEATVDSIQLDPSLDRYLNDWGRARPMITDQAARKTGESSTLRALDNDDQPTTQRLAAVEITPRGQC